MIMNIKKRILILIIIVGKTFKIITEFKVTLNKFAKTYVLRQQVSDITLTSVVLEKTGNLLWRYRDRDKEKINNKEDDFKRRTIRRTILPDAFRYWKL